MQTEVFIPATHYGPAPSWPSGRSKPAEVVHIDRPCTIVAFAAGSSVYQGEITTDVWAVAYWPTGEAFSKPVGEFKILPPADLEPQAPEPQA